MLRPLPLRPHARRSEDVHLWHIVRGANDGNGEIVVTAISAARIVVAHTGALIFLDEGQQPIYALAPQAWLSVERVPEAAPGDT